ncbi:hypothetical protein L9F63_024679 [Diploptera punctata]|uniref:DUF7064 domain-containing protein n=1 Tax=Diploptera punctata TaxID=6984 RepID=A0AAD7ZEI6_DIPPU|nr:hypothetical protein L9F63_024679 [Diploptera punctata]
MYQRTLGKWKHVKQSKNSSQSGYGLKSRASSVEMDRLQPLSDHPKAIDAVYFNTASSDGYHLVVGTAHRPHGVVNGFMILKVPEIGILETLKLPDTLIFRTGEDEKSYGAEGIKLTPVKPMKCWKIQYNGKMKLHDQPDKVFTVALKLEFTSSLPYFDFDTDMKESPVAVAMAREPWSREYFQALQSFHQTHYEQHGSFKGEVKIDDKTYRLLLDGVRDHSYGYKREWSDFHRYALHFITLENGARMNIGVVSIPLVFSRLILGYMYKPDGSLHAIENCDLKLEEHGEHGTPPLDYSFSFEAGGKNYYVQVNVKDVPEFFMGWEWEARVVEQLAQFTVNGVRGWGAAEWEYRHLEGRPDHVSTADPSWTKQLNKG